MTSADPSRRGATGLHCAVIGHPIDHSLSPVMHRAAYAELGIDWEYDAVDVPVEQLDEYLDALPADLVGLSVTAPLKRRLVELADTVGQDAELLGVGNTLLVSEGVRRVENTDVVGAVNALRERGVDSLEFVRLIGGGATAASLLLAAYRLGARQAEIVARNPETVTATADIGRQMGLAVTVTTEVTADVADLAVSTIPPSALNATGVAASAKAVFDVVYDPWPSALVAAAEDAGNPGVTGIDLLAHQAAEQVRLMTGQAVAVDVLRDAALAQLA